MRNRLLIVVVFFLPTVIHAQAQSATPEGVEFFERKVRPVLVQHCFECHSAKSKRVKGGLRVDSRPGLLEGGDNGPAIVPGFPEKSKLIEAINYQNVDLKMPKAGKLPTAVIADLHAWIKMGAPWPEEKIVKKSDPSKFDLQKRKKEHWSWQPIRIGDVPKVKDAGWPRSDVDRYLLAKLESKGLTPAKDADPRTLIRRVYFDLIGLPPSRKEVEAFVAAWDAGEAQRRAAYENVVDGLLASPRFGERWARHWLDLVRYAESRGHEFDYTIPNAYQYRDYVIRALNADVPYNQFVHEHLAGDLLKNPRLNSKEGFNESILGTAFWFLGEECHSPVDIRQDQADRFDNRIDVMTKTFLGLTVACARCHDHKFDAISTRDYYALFGLLESSNYRLARFDSMTQNQKIAEGLAKLRDDNEGVLRETTATAMTPTIRNLDAYLLTAMGREDQAKGVNSELLNRWKKALAQAATDESSPLYPLAKVAAEKNRPVEEILLPIQKRWSLPKVPELDRATVIVDFDRIDSPTPLLADDVTFGLRPRRPGEIVLGTSPTRPIARVVDLGAAERDRSLDGLRLRPGSQNESGSLGGAPRSGRTIRTPEFTLKQGKVYAHVKGAGMIYAGVGQHIMLAGPLHGRLVQKFNTAGKYQWVAVDLTTYKGQRTHLEFTPNDGIDFALSMVMQANTAPPTLHTPSAVAQLAQSALGVKSVGELAKSYQTAFAKALQTLSMQPVKAQRDAEQAPLANWIVQNADLFIVPGSEEEAAIAKVSSPILAERKKLLDQVKHESRLTPAMQDGSGTDERVFTRGNHKTPGDIVPRRFLEALAGTDPLGVSFGSGRLELAKQMTDPTTTPFITRVQVNRVWHHLFGRGIVGSVDNLGVLGEAPTHPELLDYLAHQFASPATPDGPRAGFGWSTKKLIRELVLTRAYQMASTPNAKADEGDPTDLLLHRMRIRRLEGEAIRDSILQISGRLNPAMFGPSIPVHLTAFQDGRGKPASGPLDGDGRRSVYLAVRRNFLSSFLLAFDTPSPFSTVGRRTVSNVPAQALILMNDPFVHQQAEVWAKRVTAQTGSIEFRVQGMYLDAFGRPPSLAESKACQAYLTSAPDVRRWADLAHVLINTKEFYFVN